MSLHYDKNYSNNFAFCFARSAAARFAGGVEGASTAGSPKKIETGSMDGDINPAPALDG